MRRGPSACGLGAIQCNADCSSADQALFSATWMTYADDLHGCPQWTVECIKPIQRAQCYAELSAMRPIARNAVVQCSTDGRAGRI